MKAIEVVRTFGHAEGGPVIPEKQFLALKAGDKIVIQLHGEHDQKEPICV
jgi:hypothetical protein